MAERTLHSSRYSRKRGSYDSALKPEPTRSNKSKNRDTKRPIAQLSIDLNSQKHLSLMNARNHTYRIKQNDLCELREEVQQLRMQNQSLKEELRITKSTETELKYKIVRIKEEQFEKQKKIQLIKKDYELELVRLEAKVDKYSNKIKQLYADLIQEKKKNASIDTMDEDQPQMRFAMSPSVRSSSNPRYYRRLEKQGEKDFYSSLHRDHISEALSMAWNSQNSQPSPDNFHRIMQQKQALFGRLY